MDDVARHFYNLAYSVAFLEKKGDAFQDLFSDVMEKRYPADFQRVRPWGRSGDRKNDGYLKSQRILFQCYAPNEMRATACVKKIDEDFEGALPHWEEHFDKWVFVHNASDGLGPDVLARLLALNDEHASIEVLHWGREELRQRLFELAEVDIAAILGPVPTRRIMMDLGLADLEPVLDQIERLPAIPPEKLRAVPPNKLDYNLLSADAAQLLRVGMSKEALVGRYFQRRVKLQDQLAARFRSEYERLHDSSLAPDLVFTHLQRFAAGSAIPTPTRHAAVLAVLAYFFEKCDIFEEPPSEDEA